MLRDLSTLGSHKEGPRRLLNSRRSELFSQFVIYLQLFQNYWAERLLLFCEDYTHSSGKEYLHTLMLFHRHTTLFLLSNLKGVFLNNILAVDFDWMCPRSFTMTHQKISLFSTHITFVWKKDRNWSWYFLKLLISILVKLYMPIIKLLFFKIILNI